MGTEFTVDYFIKKFEAIPDELWSVGNYESGGKCCALGHCGERLGTRVHESVALARMFDPLAWPVSHINDGLFGTIVTRYGNTPKERILNALREIKSKEEGRDE